MVVEHPDANHQAEERLEGVVHAHGVGRHLGAAVRHGAVIVHSGHDDRKGERAPQRVVIRGAKCRQRRHDLTSVEMVCADVQHCRHDRRDAVIGRSERDGRVPSRQTPLVDHHGGVRADLREKDAATQKLVVSSPHATLQATRARGNGRQHRSRRAHDHAGLAPQTDLLDAHAGGHRHDEHRHKGLHDGRLKLRHVLQTLQEARHVAGAECAQNDKAADVARLLQAQSALEFEGRCPECGGGEGLAHERECHWIYARV
mmetsp:Transcript_41195/g.106663  ORF Transcript_41195/g.106663 Transcript_41195/m.106663 type:complete len:258 (+) Transcript_41195:1734-2507(+)